MDRRHLLKFTSFAVAGAPAMPAAAPAQGRRPPAGLWGVWDQAFAQARLVSLSHVLEPDSPVWKGLPPITRFAQGAGRLDEAAPCAPFTYEKTGLESKVYTFAADRFGTQLDPPAHWHLCFPAIGELPPTLASEDWLMANGYMQAEGVAHFDRTPETGALVAIGFPRLKGGTGRFASFTATCPPEWSYGTRSGEVPEAPLPLNEKRLVWNEAKEFRERAAACDKPNGIQSFN
ncbi:MAG: hypothetical protein IPL15_02940 [Comamonadaceae bacterium]|uniref:hypothetical protein n=1 Tax=Candidatus Skiveiella danica TaxID=3386177 RepID=UPI00390A9692|nr:hypothetical protein [Comamonadaceae bacterium]